MITSPLPAPADAAGAQSAATAGERTSRHEGPAHPAGPPKLSRAQLLAAQRETLGAPRLHYSLLARILFKAMDAGYGRRGSVTKFIVLEYIARVPYQTWERAGYRVLASRRRQSALAARVFERIVETRAEQDNEQWHLLILQDLAQRQGLRQSFARHRAAPWLIAAFYYHISWLMFLIRPEWSYRLNADFEDHAEHEYMSYVAGHPELEAQPDPGSYAAEYGRYASVADVLRQIGHDERIHKLDSVVNMRRPRFDSTVGQRAPRT